MSRWIRHRVGARDHEMRLDRWFRQQFPWVPHSLLHKQLRKRKIRLNQDPMDDAVLSAAHAHSILREGATVVIDAHLLRTSLREEEEGRDTGFSRSPANVSDQQQRRLIARVVYQDPNYFILDKPHGLAVQVLLPETTSSSCRYGDLTDVAHIGRFWTGALAGRVS